MKGFRQFLLRGNVIDLAIAVVMGAAFGAVVSALVKDLLTPLIAAIVGKPDFSALTFTINNSKFLYGDFINAVISFLIVSAVIYFFVVTPYNKLQSRMAKGEEPAPPAADIALLTEIRDLLAGRQVTPTVEMDDSRVG
jgi:large conductance mechanosensitive channel